MISLQLRDYLQQRMTDLSGHAPRGAGDTVFYTKCSVPDVAA
jgi:hypothetical protein